MIDQPKVSEISDMTGKGYDSYGVHSLMDADRALMRLAENMRAIQALEAEAEAGIQRITEDKIVQAKPIHDEIIELEAGLAEYIDANKLDLFEGLTYENERKSLALNHGSIGFRQSTKIKTKKNTLALCELLGKMDATFNNGIKLEKKLNKEAMKTWPDEKLMQVAAEKKVEDTPYYETNEFSLKDL